MVKSLKEKLCPESTARIDERVKLALKEVPLSELRQAMQLTQ
jgi:hypothetical protein